MGVEYRVRLREMAFVGCLREYVKGVAKDKVSGLVDLAHDIRIGQNTTCFLKGYAFTYSGGQVQVHTKNAQQQYGAGQRLGAGYLQSLAAKYPAKVGPDDVFDLLKIATRAQVREDGQDSLGESLHPSDPWGWELIEGALRQRSSTGDD